LRLMLASRVILTICHTRPRIRCGRPSSMSPEPMLTTCGEAVGEGEGEGEGEG